MANLKDNDQSTVDKNLLAVNYYAGHKQFWTQELNNIDTMEILCNDGCNYEEEDRQGYQHAVLSKSDVQTLSIFTKGSKKALSILTLACLNIFLNRYSGQSDVVIGMAEIDENGTPYQFIMRNNIKYDMTFKELLFQVKDNYLKVAPYKEIPLYMLNQILGRVNEEEFTKLPCQIMLVCDSHFDISKLKQEIIFLVEERDGEMTIGIRYEKRTFNTDSIQRYLNNFVYLLSHAVEQMETAVWQVDILCPGEKEDIYVNFNATSQNFEPVETIVSLFDRQAEQTPEKTALVCGGTRVSYQALKEMSERIGSFLLNSDVGPGAIVGILLERSIELFAGLLGILRTGAAYLPLDPNYPLSRITYMIQDSGACTLLSRTEYTKSLDCEFIDVQKALEESEGKPAAFTDSTAAAYVIYTSGSTGMPKGVVIEHRSVHNFIRAMEREGVFKKMKNVLSLTTVCFDIFVLESWGSLSLGKTVILATEEVQRDPNLVCRLIMEEEVELLQATPSRIQSLTLCKKGPEALRKLKSILIGGEPFPIEFMRFVKYNKLRSRIYNLYGPTETTVWSTIKMIIPDNGSINIGKPIDNTQVYIVGNQLENLPVLAVGELCIGGKGLARGYQGNEVLTKERFVELPCVGTHVYRTGDYARLNNLGEIEFIGRRDSQIKVRGYRIELEEIENHLKKIEGIKEAAVAIQKDDNGDSILCAYCVLQMPMDPKSIRERLGEVLPEYMIPNFIYQIDALPFTLNEKLDRKMLPKLGRLLHSTEKLRDTTETENSNEEKLLAIFCKVLNLEEVGVKEDFFDIGGHSLNVIQLEVECEKEGIPLTVTDIFKFRTIQALSDYLLNKEQSTLNSENTLPHRKEFVELEGVVPFEKIFYKNCFYNCLFSVITYYNKQPSSILTSEYTQYDTNSTEESVHISIRYVNEKSTLDKLRDIGLVLNEAEHEEDIIEAVKAAIQCGDPVILRVDPFYESMRKDAYHKLHLPHAWVVYGFDDSSQTFRILEHMHKDDMKYRSLTISYKEAVACHEGYKANRFTPNEPDLYRFRVVEDATDGEVNTSVLYRMIFKKNRPNIEEGILELERVVEKLTKIQDNERIEIEQRILASINDIVNSKGVELYKLKCYFGEGKVSRLGEILLELWKSVRDVMYKNILTRKENGLLILTQRIPVIVEAERNLLEELTK